MKQLLPHQIEDAAFLAARAFAANFSGMGSGKTLTALEAVLRVHDGENKIVIVGPPISLSMWRDEFEDHTGLTAQIVRKSTEKLGPEVAYIMSYQIATKRRDELKLLNASVLICDESHSLKSIDAKRTKAILGAGGLCESVMHTWLLTGTPSTRWNDDLFPFLCRADARGMAERVGRVAMDRFRLKFCVTQKKRFSPHQRHLTEITVGNRNTDELNEWIFSGGLAVRRELADVWAAMPPLTVNRLEVELDADAELKAALKGLDGHTPSELQAMVARTDPALATIRRQLGRAKVKHSVSEIVDRIDAGITPILVGCIHHEVIDALAAAFQGKATFRTIDGRTSARDRDAAVSAFNDGEIDLLIGQIHSMGVSLNMQGGSHIVVIEEDWSPAIMDQLYARCHRIGQVNHVHVDIFESDTKLDRAIRRIGGDKAAGHRRLMQQGNDHEV